MFGTLKKAKETFHTEKENWANKFCAEQNEKNSLFFTTLTTKLGQMNAVLDFTLGIKRN